MTACENFTPCFDWPACDDECFGCANCMGHPDDHQTARPADSDGQPGPSGAPDVAQGAPLQACDEFFPSLFGFRNGLCLRCLCPEADHQTPQSGPRAGATEGNAVDAEGALPLAPAPAAPALHGAASPSGAAEDRPDQDNAPLVGAPHASPVDLSPAPEPTGLAPDGWELAMELGRQSVELATHMGRLSMVLELVLEDIDAGRPVQPHLVALGHGAIAKAREATA